MPLAANKTAKKMRREGYSPSVLNQHIFKKIMRFLIVDDHALIRSGLSEVLKRHFPTCSCLTAANGEEALTTLGATEINLAVVDLFIPGEDAFSHLRKLCDNYPELPVVILSATEHPMHIRKCIDLGASAFVPKSAAEAVLIHAINTALAGGYYVPTSLISVVNAATFNNDSDLPPISIETITSTLTERQVQILTMVAQGKTNKQIARECGVTDNTVKVHVSAILRSLGLSNRTQAGLLGQKLGLMSGDFSRDLSRNTDASIPE
jgi:DNA-binding NarL/FixJ family response regulator